MGRNSTGAMEIGVGRQPSPTRLGSTAASSAFERPVGIARQDLVKISSLGARELPTFQVRCV